MVSKNRGMSTNTTLTDIRDTISLQGSNNELFVSTKLLNTVLIFSFEKYVPFNLSTVISHRSMQETITKLKCNVLKFVEKDVHILVYFVRV